MDLTLPRRSWSYFIICFTMRWWTLRHLSKRTSSLCDLLTEGRSFLSLWSIVFAPCEHTLGSSPDFLWTNEHVRNTSRVFSKISAQCCLSLSAVVESGQSMAAIIKRCRPDQFTPYNRPTTAYSLHFISHQPNDFCYEQTNWKHTCLCTDFKPTNASNTQ